MGKHTATKDHSAKNAVMATAVALGTLAVATPAASAMDMESLVGQEVGAELSAAAIQTGLSYADYMASAFISSLATDVALPEQSAIDAAQEAPTATIGQHIADIALSKVGAPYSYGSQGPDAFDCSGLTSWSYAQVGKSIPRTSDAQAYSGVQVSRDQLQIGDIISFYSGATHVGIYIGEGKVVHALNSSNPVRIDDIDYLPYNNAVRF